jgi:hypothetical protein
MACLAAAVSPRQLADATAAAMAAYQSRQAVEVELSLSSGSCSSSSDDSAQVRAGVGVVTLVLTVCHRSSSPSAVPNVLSFAAATSTLALRVVYQAYPPTCTAHTSQTTGLCRGRSRLFVCHMT